MFKAKLLVSGHAFLNPTLLLSVGHLGAPA